MDRYETMRAGLSKSHRIIEVGPSHNPIAPKADGWRITIIDHTDKAGLVEIYGGLGVPTPHLIEDVDYIWKGQDLRTLIPVSQHGSFDTLIASHVIEHLPNPIGFLREVSTL